MIEIFFQFLKDVLSAIFNKDYLSKCRTDKFLKNFIGVLINIDRIRNQLEKFNENLSDLLKEDSLNEIYLISSIVDDILTYLDDIEDKIGDYDRINYIIDIESRGDILTRIYLEKYGIFSIWRETILHNKKCFLMESGYIYIPNYSFLLKYDINSIDDIMFELKGFYSHNMFFHSKIISELRKENSLDSLVESEMLEKIKIPEENYKINYIIECTKCAIDGLNESIKKSKEVLKEFVGDNKIDIIKYL